MAIENLIHPLSDEQVLVLYKQWKEFRHHTGFITDEMPQLREMVDAYSSTLEKLGVNTSPVHVVDDFLTEEIADRWAQIIESKGASPLLSVSFPVPEGTPAWYVDFDRNELERATTSLVVFKDGKCDSISLNFPDTDDFDEFIGSALGRDVFFSKQAAQDALLRGSRCKYDIRDGQLIERPAVVQDKKPN